MPNVMQKNDSKYRRMLERLPEQMKELMRHVHHECVILEHHAGSMGWHVDFQIGNTDLSLIYDRGSLVVIKDPTGEEKNLFPEGKDWTEVSMQDLVDEVKKEFA